MLNQEQIKEIIPHRDPFLMIDEVVELIPGKRAVALKHVKIEEPYFKGHFPGAPVMPGVLVVEALAQTGAVAILSKDEFKGKTAFFGGIQKARFRKQIHPGDTIRLEVDIPKVKGNIGLGITVAYVNDEKAVEADITFAIC